MISKKYAEIFYVERENEINKFSIVYKNIINLNIF